MKTGSERILIVDDDTMTRTLLTRGLEHYGFANLTCAQSGAVALRVLGLDSDSGVAKGPPPMDVVLLDVSLPDMNGFEICYRIKQAYGKALPVIFVTSFMMDNIEDRFLKSGGDDFLRKPITPEELQARVKMLLERRRQVLADARRTPTRKVRNRATAAHAVPYTGDRIGGYEVVDMMTRTSSSLIYQVRRIRDGRMFVLKMLPVFIKRDSGKAARFVHEMSVITQMRHPHIVRIFAEGDHNGSPYFVQEYIEGLTLTRLIDRDGFLSFAQVMSVARGVGAALHHLHEQGILHRDVTTNNIILRPDGVPKLFDFGIAMRLGEMRMTQPGLGVGTPAYMAPEQFLDGQISPASDIYSFGSMLYHVITGHPPFTGATVRELVDQQVTLTPQPLRSTGRDVPRAWETFLIKRCLAKKAGRRPGSMAEVLRMIDRLETARF